MKITLLIILGVIGAVLLTAGVIAIAKYDDDKAVHMNGYQILGAISIWISAVIIFADIIIAFKI